MKSNMFFILVWMMSSCVGCSSIHSNDNSSIEQSQEPILQDSVIAESVIEPAEPIIVENVAPKQKKNCFIVISKLDLTLIVYEKIGADTVAIAQYPVCLSKNKGNKEKVGDMKTPESPKGKPFSIVGIQDASKWEHDFGDGRGKILSYGHWFLRLKTPGHNGIGIHGSTNNEESVPGRASEGCIRLRDTDIILLKENYAYVGMPVIIKAEEEGALSFEK